MENLGIETALRLDKFQPRSYQIPIVDALENKKYKRILAILPRRAGKDVVAWNLIIRAAIRKQAVYYYILPTYSQARKVIWDSIMSNSMRFLDFIPPELIDSTNSSEMKVRLTNGSIIQLVGSDNVDSLVGSNPAGVVYSEYALQDPKAYQLLRPILVYNQGFMIFISTPRGKNHLWELYNIAQNSSEWFCTKLTVNDTGHIPLSEIEKERAEGLMSEDLIAQEYYTDFNVGIEGSYYSRYIEKLRLRRQIGEVPWTPEFRVHTAWDLGVRDSTSIIFFQVAGMTIRIIDYYENSKQGLEHYVKILDGKADAGYQYGKHFAPHDIAVTEWGTGLTRLEKARHLGIKFETMRDSVGKMVSVLPNISLEDGIECVRTTLPKCWIDEEKCSKLLDCLENYRQEYDEKKRVYKNTPLHNWASNGADAMRYLSLSLPKTRDGMSASQLESNFMRARQGEQGQLPAFFRDAEPF